MGYSRKWKSLESSEVFKEKIMGEHWVSSVRNYLWPWGVDTVGEGSEYKWEEQEDVLDSIES